MSESVSSSAVPLNAEALERLESLAQGYVTSGVLPSMQIAVAHGGRLILQRNFGATSHGGEVRPVTDGRLFHAYSAGKPVIASAVWLAMHEAELPWSTPVAHLLPYLTGAGMDAVTVEHLITHEAELVNAPFDAEWWDDVEARERGFRRWSPRGEVGTRFVYHPQSAWWLLAAVLEAITKVDYRTYVHTRIIAPLVGDGFFFGVPERRIADVADVVMVGTHPEQATIAGFPVGDVDAYEAYLLRFNTAAYRGIGAPGSGLVCAASGLALYYQGLLAALAGDTRVWPTGVVADNLKVVHPDRVDPATGQLAMRARGVVVSGDDMRLMRGFPPTLSEQAFGHPGVGGQFAWADPASGLSFALMTSGLERDAMQLGMRALMVATAASQLLS